MSTQSTDRSPERPANRFEVSGRDRPGAGNIETALARNRAFAAAGSDQRPTLVPAPADTTPQEPDVRSFDPTQGRKIGSDPYDDVTQGRKLGSDPYDDVTQGRELGSDPYDDVTQGRELGSDPYDDVTQGRKLGSDPYDDPTRAR
jgi:hypothetical protein